MADLKISELQELGGEDLRGTDELAIVDDSASETKKIGVQDLIENGLTLISNDSIPGAKILFAAGDIDTTALADDAVTTAKIADNTVTAAQLADESSVNLVTSLPASGAFRGQIALDTDDNKIYVWDGSAWAHPKAAGSINNVTGSTVGVVNIVSTINLGTAAISATLDDTSAAAQFLAGPVGAAGALGYRTIDGGDLPAATTSAKGGVIVNGNGLQMNGDNIEIANTITSSSTRHLVSYDANGLVTGGGAIAAGDLPIATTSSVGGVIVSDGLAVDASGNLSVDNTVTAGEYTKVTVTERGLVSSGGTLDADDIPNHSAAKLTSGTISSSLIAADAITAAKLADQSTTKFGGATGSDNVTIFPAGDFKGQFFYDETTQDLYIYTGSAFVPVTVLSGNLVNAGAYNASTNQMSSVTSAGSSAGFSVGNALPAPAKTNLNHYVVVDTSGTGSGAAPAVALAPPDMLLSQGVGTEFSLIDVSNAIAGQTAANISLIATGDVVATDVQAAITELDQEKLPKAGGTMTGDLELNNADIVFEGSTDDDYETTLTVTDPTADRTITLPNVTGTVVTTGDSGTVTSTMIANGTIANADISSSAEIAVSKLASGTARQVLQTNAAGTAPEFVSNVVVPGTLAVNGLATCDATLTVTGLISADGKVSFPAGTAAEPSLYFGDDTDTGFFSGGSDFIGISTGGTAKININSSGQVGIGVALPTQTIDIADSTPTARFAATGQTAAQIFLESDRDTTNALLGRITGQWNDTDVATISFRTGNDTTNKDDGAITFGTASAGVVSEQMRLDKEGRLLIGTTSARTSSGGSNPVFQIEGTGANASTMSITRNTNNNSPCLLKLAKSRGTTLGSNTAVVKNDRLGTIDYCGADGDQLQIAAQIRAVVDQDPGDDDMPGRLEFNTTANGGTSALRRVTIDSAGSMLVGTTETANDTYIANNNVTPKLQVETDDETACVSITRSTGAASNLILQRGGGSNNNVPGNTTTVGQITFNSYDGTNYRTCAQINARLDDTPATADVPGRLGFMTSNDGSAVPTEKMRITSDGKIGIGTTGPNAKLTVKDLTNFSINSNTIDYTLHLEGGATAGNGNYGASLGFSKINAANRTGAIIASKQTSDDADQMGLAFLTHQSTATDANMIEQMVLTHGGSLLLHSENKFSSSNGAHLQIKGRADEYPARIALMRNDTDVSTANSLAEIEAYSEHNNVITRVGKILFAAAQNHSDTARGTRFGVTTTKSGTTTESEKFRVNNNGLVQTFGDAASCAQFRTTLTGPTNSIVSVVNGASNLTTGGTTVFKVLADGDVENTNDSYGAISDVKLKENIVDAESQWDDFKAVRFRKYNFKEETGFGTHTQLGVIAQEVEEISPGLVKTSPDLDDEGNDLGTTTKSVKYSILTKKGLVALQEAMERIETLEAKVAALEAGN